MGYRVKVKQFVSDSLVSWSAVCRSQGWSVVQGQGQAVCQ